MSLHLLLIAAGLNLCVAVIGPLLSWIVLRRVKRALGDRPLTDVLPALFARATKPATDAVHTETGAVKVLRGEVQELSRRVDILGRVLAEREGIKVEPPSDYR